MLPDDEVRRRFQEIIGQLGPGDLRDVAHLVQQAASNVHAESLDFPSRTTADLRRARFERPAMLIVRVELNRSHPPIWRRLELRSDLTLLQVHQAIQAAYGWLDYHLHRFGLGGDPFGRGVQCFACPEDLAEEDDGSLPTTDVRLDEVMQVPGDVLEYVYDYGDNWDLTLTLESIEEAHERLTARCLDGERAAPPEDCGGIRDEEELREVLPDPAAFDVEEVNNELLNPLSGLVDWGVRADVISFMQPFRGRPEGDAMVVAVIGASGPGRTKEQDRAAALAPITSYLEYVGDGLDLTEKGYLKPADLKVVAGFLPEMWNYIHPISREGDCTEALHFRIALQHVGLLRKAKGRLTLTKAGARARTSPDYLWTHLSSRLLSYAGDEVTTTSRIAVMVATAAGERDPHATAAGWLTMLGWVVGPEREPVEKYDLYDATHDMTSILRNMSTTPVRWDDTQPSVAAIDLAQRALLTSTALAPEA